MQNEKTAGSWTGTEGSWHRRLPGAGTGQIGYRVLGIYLNDHLAGATAGTELAHRVARTHRAHEPDGQLKRLAVEVARDRAALIGMMKALGVPVRSYKVFAAWAGKKAGRVKFNGLARPVAAQRPRRAGAAPARRRRQGGRLAHPAALADADMRLDPEQLDELCSGRGARQTCSKNSGSGPRSRSSAPDRRPVNSQKTAPPGAARWT